MTWEEKMPIQTIRQLKEYLEQLGLPCTSKIEDESLILTVTSPDFTDGEWQHGEYGDELIERGKGWQLENVFAPASVEELDSISDSLAVTPEPFLVFHSYNYAWPAAANIERDLTIADIVELLGILTTGNFPHAYFDEEISEL
jgi:hypothetical protein